MDDVIRFAPAHFEQVLCGFGGNRAQTADENYVLGFELREQNQEEIAKRIIKEDVEDDAATGNVFPSNHATNPVALDSSVEATNNIPYIRKGINSR